MSLGLIFRGQSEFVRFAFMLDCSHVANPVLEMPERMRLERATENKVVYVDFK